MGAVYQEKHHTIIIPKELIWNTQPTVYLVDNAKVLHNSETDLSHLTGVQVCRVYVISSFTLTIFAMHLKNAEKEQTNGSSYLLLSLSTCPPEVKKVKVLTSPDNLFPLPTHELLFSSSQSDGMAMIHLSVQQPKSMIPLDISGGSVLYQPHLP